jgi:transcriptional regulator with XRE-family HTH domain
MTETTTTETVSSAVAYGRQIAARRCAMGLKRKHLAAAAGISYAYLAAIENGDRMPSYKMQVALAAALNTPLTEILAAVEPSASVSAAGEPTLSDLMAEIRALRRLVEELAAR